MNLYQLHSAKKKRRKKRDKKCIISSVIMNLPSQSTPCELILFLQTLQNTFFLKLMGFVQWWVMGSCVNACYVFGVCSVCSFKKQTKLCSLCSH